MKAVKWTQYGPPEGLAIGEMEKPVPGENGILVKIHAVTVNAGDCEMRGLKLPLALSIPLRLFNGFKAPKRITLLGQDFAGEVEAVGKSVTGFKPGDRVFGSTEMGLGTYAEYVCLKQGALNYSMDFIPDSLNYTQAAVIPVSGIEALYFLKKAKIKKGESVLVIGAGGSIGNHGVQLAKHLGAHVTAVDRGEKREMLESLGAEHFIDYLKEDYLNNDIKYDVIFDVAGKIKTGSILKKLSPKGRYLLLNPTLSKFAGALFVNMTGGKKIVVGGAKRTSEDLNYLKDLADKGVLRIVIDRTFSLDDIAKAHAYAESGLKKGHIVIKVIK